MGSLGCHPTVSIGLFVCYSTTCCKHCAERVCALRRKKSIDIYAPPAPKLSTIGFRLYLRALFSTHCETRKKVVVIMPTRLSVPYVTPWEIYAASVVLPFLASVFVLLRFYARTLLKNSTGIDDWLMLPALVCTPYSTPRESCISDRKMWRRFL